MVLIFTGRSRSTNTSWIFFAADLMLAIEIDGDSHKLKGTEDEERQRRLESLGVRLLRFDDAMVKANLDAGVRAIDEWIAANAT